MSHSISDYDKKLKQHYPTPYYPDNGKTILISNNGWIRADLYSNEYRQGCDWYIEFKDELMCGFIRDFSIWGIRPRYLKIIIVFAGKLKNVIEYLSELGISDVLLKKCYDDANMSNQIIITEYSYDDTFLDIEDVTDESQKIGLQLKRRNKDFTKLIQMMLYNNSLHLPRREIVDKHEELKQFEELCLAGTWKWDEIHNLIISNTKPLLKTKSSSFKINRNRSNSSRFNIFSSKNVPKSPSPLNTPRNNRTLSDLSDNK